MSSRRVPFGFLILLLLPFFASAQSAQSSCPDLSRDLFFGSGGSDVIALQNFLIAQNLLPQGDNTGYFGRLTKAAAIEFQTQQSLPTTGFVGPLTRAAIAKVCVENQTVNHNQTINQTTNTNQQTEPKVAGIFSASPTTGIAPLGIEFVYADPTPGYTYTVDFGDGSSGVLTTDYGIAHSYSSSGSCASEGCQVTPPSYSAYHTYASGGTYIAKTKDASGNVLGTATITLVNRPPTVTFTVPGTVTLSTRQTAVRNIGTSQDALEVYYIETGNDGSRYADFTWQTRDCSTAACADTEPYGVIGSISGVLNLNSSAPNPSWRTPEGYLIALIALTASTATFQISQ